MNKEIISDKQGIDVVTILLIGSATIFTSGLSAHKDLWLAIVLGLFLSLPIVLIIARLHYLFPNNNLFDILVICFGNVIGRILIVFFIWFSFENSAEIMKNSSQFITTMSLENTPEIIIVIFITILCIWATKKGAKEIYRLAEIVLFPLIIGIVITILLLIPKMEAVNILPILGSGIKPVLKGSIDVTIFPFTQIIFISMFFSDFNQRKSPYKVYIIGVLNSGILILAMSITSILVLGINGTLSIYYPSYVVATRINIGNTLKGIEIITGSIFLIGVFIKLSLHIIGTCKGIAKLLEFSDYKFIIIPIALLMVNLTYFEFDSIMEYFEFDSKVWNHYAFPFQIILPIIIWITAEIKNKHLFIN